MKQVVVITGITGQDGSLLAERYLDRDYKVFGLIRRTSNELLGNAESLKNDVELVQGDVTDAASLLKLCKLAKPNIFINCAAQSHVGLSFDMPEYTLQVTGVGVLNCLEAIRLSGIHSKFLQLSSSEMFGSSDGSLLTEASPMKPNSPYASAKLLGYNLTRNYRESYKMFACNSIAFNHEMPGRRGPSFVTRKITKTIAGIKAGRETKLTLGNLDSERDWGYAPEFVDGMMRILDYPLADDWVLATGESWSVRDFCEIAFNYAGLGSYLNYVTVDPSLFRPNDINHLQGFSGKAQRNLNWKTLVPFRDLVEKMVDADSEHLLPSETPATTSTQQFSDGGHSLNTPMEDRPQYPVVFASEGLAILGRQGS